MKQRIAIVALMTLILGVCAPVALAQATGSVKGVAKDQTGKPITEGTVEWLSLDTGRKYSLKLSKKGEYFSLGIAPGKYKVTLLGPDGKEMFHINGVQVGVDEVDIDIDLQKEQQNSAAGQGVSPEQMKAQQEQQAKVAKENVTIGSLNKYLGDAKTSADAGDFETAISTMKQATEMDASYDILWFKLADYYRMSAPKQADPAAKKERYSLAAENYQKAIDTKLAHPDPKDKDPNGKLAAYYNNMADALSRTGKVDDAVAAYNKAIELNPAGAPGYYFNIAATLTNAGRPDEANAAFDKVIAADPTKAEAYYQKGVNLLGKATIKGDKTIAPDGTAECFQKYLELAPNGPNAQSAKDLLASLGATVETNYKKQKQTTKK
jgi:tetratricopeptide (TPR) repeat protein